MSKFKIGDKVVERSTGDVGVITRMGPSNSDYENGVAWYVKWESLQLPHDELWCWESELAFYNDDIPTKVPQEEITQVHDVIEYNGYLYKMIGKSF